MYVYASSVIYRKKVNYMAKITPDLVIGAKYGDWTILELRPRPKEKYYLVKCKCGLEKEISKSNLANGKSKSCNKGACKKLASTHGLTGSKLYSVWCGIKSRLHNPTGKNSCYVGIALCEEWNDFQVFYTWAMANGYTEHLSIDRIDRDGDYAPSNCRWVDAVVQSQNRSKRASKQLPKGVYESKPRGERKYLGTGKAPYYWIVIYKGSRYQKWGFQTPEEAYDSRKQFIEANFNGLVYVD